MTWQNVVKEHGLEPSRGSGETDKLNELRKLKICFLL